MCSTYIAYRVYIFSNDVMIKFAYCILFYAFCHSALQCLNFCFIVQFMFECHRFASYAFSILVQTFLLFKIFISIESTLCGVCIFTQTMPNHIKNYLYINMQKQNSYAVHICSLFFAPSPLLFVRSLYFYLLFCSTAIFGACCIT